MTTEPNDLIARIGQRLQSEQRFVLASHIRPDGDAVGSLLGLGLALEAAGKEVQMVLADGVPETFSHLEGADRVRQRPLRPAAAGATVIVLDASDLQRLGPALAGFPQPEICIDHHVTNTRFAALNLVEADQPATAAVLARYLPAWGLEITPAVAAALLTGILTDTIGFRTPSVRPDLLRLAADLMEKGADLHALYHRALVAKRLEAVRYWGPGLNRLQADGDLVWTALTLEDRRRAAYPEDDDADLVNVLSSIEGFRVAMLCVEQSGGRYKISWRTADPALNVSQVAQHFGGGGHAAAAGAERAGDLQTDLPHLVAETKALLGIR